MTKNLGMALPPALICTKSKRTADFFRENVPKFTMQMKCPAWFHWRRRRVIARRVIHCPVNWIMQDHAAFFIFHIITILIVIIISDDSSPLTFTSSREITQCKVWITTAPECKLDCLQGLVPYTHIFSIALLFIIIGLIFSDQTSLLMSRCHHYPQSISQKTQKFPAISENDIHVNWIWNNVIFRGRSHLIWSEAADIKGNFPPCGRFWSHRPCLLTLDLDKWVWWNNWNRECIAAPHNYKWQIRIWVHYSVWFWQKKNDRGNSEWELVELIDKIATCGPFQLKRGHQGWLKLLPSCHLYLHLTNEYSYVMFSEIMQWDNWQRGEWCPAGGVIFGIGGRSVAIFVPRLCIWWVIPK